MQYKIWELLTYKLIRVRKAESKIFPWVNL
jgi:hypothetical protein